MSAAIVQINFPFSLSREELENGAAEVAGVFAGVDGLLWKIWLVDEAGRTSGGIYLFRDRASAEAYSRGELVTKLRQDWPGATVQVFDVMAEPSRITRAPLPD